ncbi:MAG: VIT1/CCC1 transporter family protein [Candidatus Hadarchaeota archaeon]
MDKENTRYLVRGFIDGLLSTLGSVIGASAALNSGSGVGAATIILSAGIGSGVANGLSNVLAAFMGEKLVLGRRLEEMERAILKEEVLKDTKVAEEIHNKIMKGGIIDGISTILGSLIPVIPFVLVLGGILSGNSGLYASVILSTIIFFILGGYIGKIAKENMIISGTKMAAFGVMTALIVRLLRLALGT